MTHRRYTNEEIDQLLKNVSRSLQGVGLTIPSSGTYVRDKDFAYVEKPKEVNEFWWDLWRRAA